ncbi:hypothetical protein HG530_010767 [Fusarium avenaceum]|nr:hypothetical protein HG530_010767 [Fusarium avenaceum]
MTGVKRTASDMVKAMEDKFGTIVTQIRTDIAKNHAELAQKISQLTKTVDIQTKLLKNIFYVQKFHKDIVKNLSTRVEKIESILGG